MAKRGHLGEKSGAFQDGGNKGTQIASKPANTSIQSIQHSAQITGSKAVENSQREAKAKKNGELQLLLRR